MQKLCWSKTLVAVALCLGYVAAAHAIEVPQDKWDQLMRDVEELKTEKRALAPIKDAKSVEAALDSKYGPNANVTTKVGKLQLSLLTQIWYYTIQQEKHGFFDDPNVNGIVDSNQVASNNGFRVRRTEFKLIFDLNENITATVMFDP